MNYARVSNGKIIEARKLPETWGGIKNFSALDDAMLKSHGWVPIVEDDCNCADNETHGGPVVSVEDDHVRVRYEKRKITEEEWEERKRNAAAMLLEAEAGLEALRREVSATIAKSDAEIEKLKQESK